MSTLVAVEKKVLNSLHDKAVFRRRVKVLSLHLADALDSDGSVLDVGCGDGSIATSLMQMKPGLKIHGIDVLQRPNAQIPVTLFDGRTFPSEDKAYDWVTIIDVLHHTDDPSRVVAEAARVARRGVIIKDHLREGLGAYTTLRMMDWVGNKGHGVRLPYNYLSRAEWQAIFEKTGLEVRRWRGALSLYPFPASLAFDRKLHFIAVLRAPRRAGTDLLSPANTHREEST
jgi:2-polyprenyl-3-methyl-5-hydroxy-6-metoxy-1,4-benzoquinol methylase